MNNKFSTTETMVGRRHEVKGISQNDSDENRQSVLGKPIRSLFRLCRSYEIMRVGTASAIWIARAHLLN